MKVIGLTGGIGSGKTTAAEYLRQKGYRVMDADAIARDIMEPGEETLTKVAEVFGHDIIDREGGLDRKKLASLVFADEEKLKKLNDITHSVIRRVIKEKVKEAEEDLSDGTYMKDKVFIDAPLLFESGLDDMTDENWLVIAGEGQRAERVANRDGISREDVFQRMENQMSDREKIRRTDYILNNRGTREDFYIAISKLLEMRDRK